MYRLILENVFEPKQQKIVKKLNETGFSPDENFSQTSGAGPVDELFGLSELKVHVAVGGDEVAFVLVAPLQLDHHDLAEKAVQERLRVRHGGAHCRVREFFHWKTLILTKMLVLIRREMINSSNEQIMQASSGACVCLPWFEQGKYNVTKNF
jgi:hypothetical protein